MRLHKHLIAAAVAGAVSSGMALAQAPKERAVPTQPQPPKLDPKACSDRDRLKLGDTVETDGHTPRSEEPLSDKLARTGSVICPPLGLDPHIRAPAPHTGSEMPVIPPPARQAEPQTPAK